MLPHDLTAEIDNYSIYLPALNTNQAEYVVREAEVSRGGLQPVDLNFLGGGLWSYKWCMASAGQFAYSRAPNAITRRNPQSCHIIGDSGGFQIGTGALKDLKGWKEHAHDPKIIARLWRDSDVNRTMLGWLRSNCDLAMTIDLPLWVSVYKFRHSPFHHCDYRLLTELTVENLRYISDHRGSCEFLNVLHGNNDEEEDHWYRAVRWFEGIGYAIGGSVGPGLALCRAIKRILILRDDGMLGGRRRWLHVLGISRLPYAVIFTAIQRAIQACTGSTFTVSFDTSSPILQAQKYRKYVVPPLLGHDVETWLFPSATFPDDPAKPFPIGSPLSPLLTVDDMHPITDPFATETFDAFSFMALTNHNIYVYIRGFVEANKVTFNSRRAPAEIDDLVGTIADLFACERWADRLNGLQKLIAWLR